MSDEKISVNPAPPHNGILNQTLGEVLQNNTQAQGMIMSAMQITPEQFRELLNSAGSNQLMNQTIGDLFKNGTVQQASGQAVQVSPEQFQQIFKAPQTAPVGPNDKVPYVLPEANAQKSFMQKLKGFFGR